MLIRSSFHLILAILNVHYKQLHPRPDLPIGYIGLSLGPQGPKGPPTNCGTHRVNGRYMIIYINFVKNLYLN